MYPIRKRKERYSEEKEMKGRTDRGRGWRVLYIKEVQARE